MDGLNFEVDKTHQQITLFNGCLPLGCDSIVGYWSRYVSARWHHYHCHYSTLNITCVAGPRYPVRVTKGKNNNAFSYTSAMFILNFTTYSDFFKPTMNRPNGRFLEKLEFPWICLDYMSVAWLDTVTQITTTLDN